MQGYNEKEVFRLKWLLKDMNEYDSYMKDFMMVFVILERWGLGSYKDFLKVILLMLFQIMIDILDIGCGIGILILLLVDNSIVYIIVVDNEFVVIEQIDKKI